MQALGKWMLSLATVGLLGALLTAVAPERGKKTVRFACGVWMLILTLQPIRSLSGFSAKAVLSAYETVLAERLHQAEQTADHTATAMLVSNAQSWCEEVLCSAGVDAAVKLEYDAACGRFVGAEITYQAPPTEAERAAVAAQITAQTGVVEAGQIHH